MVTTSEIIIGIMGIVIAGASVLAAHWYRKSDNTRTERNRAEKEKLDEVKEAIKIKDQTDKNTQDITDLRHDLASERLKSHEEHARIYDRIETESRDKDRKLEQNMKLLWRIAGKLGIRDND